MSAPEARALGHDWRAELRRDYERTLPAKYDRIERRLAELAGASPDDSVLDGLLDDVHRLHGTAGTYGFVELSRLAGEWEVLIRAWRSGAAADAETLARMRARLRELRGWGEAGSPSRPLPEPEAGSPTG